MTDKNKTTHPLTDSFESEEQAGAFWDAHSAVDYKQHLEATDDTIEISERVFEVEVAEDVFKKLQEEAASLGYEARPARKNASRLHCLPTHGRV